MYDLLNIIVSIFVILFQLCEFRNEMNKQGADWIRAIKHMEKKSVKKDKRKCKDAIKGVRKRKEELNRSAEINKYTAITLVVLTVSYISLYYISLRVEPWMSGIVTLVCFILASLIIKTTTTKLRIYVDNPDDTIFVVSCILCVSLCVRRWKLGLASLGLTAGRHIWVDILQKRKPFSEIGKVFKNEQVAVFAAINMSFLYLLLYLIYRIATQTPTLTETIMFCAYISIVSIIISVGNGLKITTRITKEVVDDKCSSQK